MIIQSSIKDMILAAQKEASEAFNAPTEMLRGLDEQMKRRSDGTLYYLDLIWVPLTGDVRTLIMDKANKSKPMVRVSVLSRPWKTCVLDFKESLDVHGLFVEFSYNNSHHSSVMYARFDALYGRKYRSPILWAKVKEGQLIGHGIVQETNEKISQIKDMLKAAHDRQKT
nr:putative reverse transcriptase domain-containing protein [Tanacetum cinerariifolium]